VFDADVPDAPVDVHWTVCDGRVVQLHWKLLSENYAPVRQFIIEYNTSWTPDVWLPARSDIGRDARYFRVALSPWSNYSFRVVAQNDVGRSRPSDVTRPWCTTPPDVPRRHPRAVCARNGQPHTLVISWQVIAATVQINCFYMLPGRLKDNGLEASDMKMKAWTNGAL